MPGAMDDYLDSFRLQAAKLTMVDLWNLYLLNEMLARPHVRMALAVMAQRDRADTRSAWGGLVFYRNGQAEAVLYPFSATARLDDRRYIPGARAQAQARDCLMRFCGHFEKVENGIRAGPDAEELFAAREGDYYGVVFTSVSDKSFCAHYYTPKAAVVSLGVLEYRR
jgi:hypothetical protein